MTPKRIINIHCDDPHPDALGRLVTWAFDGYDTVDIYSDGGEDFVAHYSDTSNPDKRYVIGAVWRKDKQEFSFHS